MSKKPNQQRTRKGKNPSQPRGGGSKGSNGHQMLGGVPVQAPLNMAGGGYQKHGMVSTTISGCDMVDDIFATRVFDTQVSLRVNPGNIALFPRLHQVANVFEKYRFKRLAFHYFPIAAATESGCVVLFMETDVRDANPVTKEEMLNHYNSRRGSPWVPVTLEVSKKDLHPRPQMFVRDTLESTTNIDRRLDDLGTLHVGASVGNSGVFNPIGELWVSYEVELISPSVPTDTVESATFYTESIVDGAGITPSAGLATAAPLTANNWSEIFTANIIDVPNEKAIFSLGPVDVDLKYFTRNLNSTTAWSTIPTVTSWNGATIRNSDTSGDFAASSNGVGGWSILENIISLPGTLVDKSASIADLLNLPHIRVIPGILSAGFINSSVLKLTPSASSLNSTPPWPSFLSTQASSDPPQPRSKAFWAGSALRLCDLLKKGRFHLGGKDVVVRHNHSVFLTGRGEVPQSSPLFALSPSPKHDLAQSATHATSTPTPR